MESSSKARTGPVDGLGVYSSQGYAASLGHIGEAMELPDSGVWLLRRAISGSDLVDACGCYPLMSCTRGKELINDLDAMQGSVVSVTAILDPLATPGRDECERTFCDLYRPFKRHYLVDLSVDQNSQRSGHHRRSVRRALRDVEVEHAEDPRAYALEWVDLYQNLMREYAFDGDPAAFTPDGLTKQLALDGVHYYRAIIDGVCQGACLWLEQGDHIVYHLGASSDVGRKSKASFALFDRALRDAGERGLERANLGGAAGMADDEKDGLAMFKRGWSAETVDAYLGGRIVDREAYSNLCQGDESVTFFPAYRAKGRT
jgi:hypothetical protein